MNSLFRTTMGDSYGAAWERSGTTESPMEVLRGILQAMHDQTDAIKANSPAIPVR